MRGFVVGLWLVASCALSVSAMPPAGGGVSVSPVRVDLRPGRRAEAITLTNTGTSRRTIEVQTMRWTQMDGEDRYEPTRELLANPQRFSLEPGASQIVRIGRPSSAPALRGNEVAYRVYLQETERAELSSGGLQFALRIGVPVFVLPEASVKPQVDWVLNRDDDGGLRLRARNTGSQHARLADLRLQDASGGEWPLDGFRYVLPGQWQEWRVVPAQAPRQLPQRLAVLTENGRVEHDVGADTH